MRVYKFTRIDFTSHYLGENIEQFFYYSTPNVFTSQGVGISVKGTAQVETYNNDFQYRQESCKTSPQKGVELPF